MHVHIHMHLPHCVHCGFVCSGTAWSKPCCGVVSASISAEDPFSAVVASLRELEDGGTEGRFEESATAGTKEV